ncbi:hypothetical protein VL15_37920 [Burkholderia cepacia]|uniref:Uncharacterized protein n=1 Tax=Burkholderia cepacia TaxID=292 RepID=A0A0J5VYB8_BURCE|nr:type III secretion system needle filament subunit SctF [Burkholderia cepacia]KML41974.1 hypothetical protein VL15_37920 [Burkholderia cepacia]
MAIADTDPFGTVGADGSGTLDGLSEDFDNGVSSMETSLSTALSNLEADPSNPMYLAAYQSDLSEYTLFRNAQSNSVKVIKDTDSSIISNMR